MEESGIVNNICNITIDQFQACTGIEDVGEAFSHLEAVQWDLLVSILTIY
jgi:UBA-like domain